MNDRLAVGLSEARRGAAELAEIDRLRAEAEASAQRFRELVDGLDAIVWEADPSTLRFSFVSQRVENMLGYSVERCISEPGFWAKKVHPDDRKRAVAFCRRAAAEGRHNELEYRMIAADGRVVWVHDTRGVVRDAEGRPWILRGVLVDISVRKQAEARMAGLLEIAKDITGTLDLDEILQRVQRRMAALLPCERVITYYWDPKRDAFPEIARYGLPEELAQAADAVEFHRGQPIVDLLASGQTVVVNDVLDQNLVSIDMLKHFGISALIAVPMTVRGRILGALVAVNAGSAKRFDADQVQLLESIARHLAMAIEAADLYRNQQEEAKIAAALARVGREMISALDTPVILDRLCQLTTEVLGCDCSHALLSKPEEDVFVPISGHGYPPEQWECIRVTTLPRAVLAPGLDRLKDADVANVCVAYVPHILTAVLAREYGITRALTAGLRRGGDIIGMLVACDRGPQEPFTPQQERIAQGIAQLASLALENARLVEELGRAIRLKSDFVATMSHELRTPLNVIVGYNSLLLDAAFGEVTPEQADPLRRVENSANELLDLINATLDVSRLETGRLPLDLQEISVAELIEAVDAETRALQQKPGVRFVWDVQPQLPRLRTDPIKLKVVLKNLISNAVKFTDEGSVTVAVQRRDGAMEFRVTDTGIGIPAEAHKLIFEPFRQVDSSPTRHYGGVGLGLYIVRRLVEILGGAITVDSEVGRGSTFHVTVPDRSGPESAES